MTGFANLVRSAGDQIEELSLAYLKVKLRAGIDAGNWPQRGNAIFAALAESGRPVVLAIDELPILVNRLLKDEGRAFDAGGAAGSGRVSELAAQGRASPSRSSHDDSLGQREP